MPHYDVLVFGFKGTQAIWNAAQSLGLSLMNEDEDTAITDKPSMITAMENGALGIEVPSALQSRIDALFVQAVNGLPGHAYKGVKVDEWGFKDHQITTPFGQRRSSGLHIGLAFDPYECNDTLADAVLGFFLTSRYTPAFLDLHQKHGGAEGVTSENTRYIEALIKAEFPEWERAKMHLHTLFA